MRGSHKTFLSLCLIVFAGLNSTLARPTSKPAPKRPASGQVYPQFRSQYGVIHWLPEQMPLKVYVSPGSCLDGYVDESTGAPRTNVDNKADWPFLAAQVLSSPEALNSLPQAQEFNEGMRQAATQGIQMWKAFEREGLFRYELTDNPADADIYVFWTHHFVNKLGLGLFANDIRGVTSKESFPYKAILAGGQADFKPVVILLRTTEPGGTPMPYDKLRAAAAHEMGHALGIEDHSPNPGDLMSIYYGRGVISANDAATIRYLYRLTPDLIP
ncbi:MAG: matrixin family metalloprotease [Candidatus Obscuribacterales bacterium]|nr:matrixin family metalloprotease [Candidatus Obscuribacterales bacterium]